MFPAELPDDLIASWTPQQDVPLVFPGPRGKPLSHTPLYTVFKDHGIAAVPHGFRSSFRDWAAEETDHPREVVEAALAHVVQRRARCGPSGGRPCQTARTIR